MNTAAKLQRKPQTSKKFSTQTTTFKHCSHIMPELFEKTNKAMVEMDIVILSLLAGTRVESIPSLV